MTATETPRRRALVQMAAAMAQPMALITSGLAESRTCPVCKGTGRDPEDPNLNCADCGGTGEVQ